METYIVYSEAYTPARGYNLKVETVAFSKQEAAELTKELNAKSKRRIFKYRKVANTWREH